jgi:guanine nucleotide-binding protein G(i) subunit alpha
MEYTIETHNNQAYFAPEIAEAIDQLVKDPEIPKLIDEHSSEFYLMDSAQ